MIESIRKELTEYAKEMIFEQNYNLDDEELHFKLFNEDYYLIGYYDCAQWLKKHDIGEFESIELLEELFEEYYGEVQTYKKNAESIVNLIVYFYGFEILADFGGHCQICNNVMDNEDFNFSDICGNCYE